MTTQYHLAELNVGRLIAPTHDPRLAARCDRVVEFEDEHIALLEDCITRRLGFSPATKSIRIEANCDELARLGTCKNRRK